MKRFRPPGVRSVELWNQPLPDGRELWRVAGAPFVEAGGGAEAIVRAVLTIARRRQADLGFRRLRLTGGLTLLPGFAAAVATHDLPFPVSVHGRFAGVEAGLAMFPGALVVDLGQTALKLGFADQRRIVPRPPSLPRRFFHEGALEDPKACADHVFAWLQAEIADIAAPLLLALPCPLADDLVLGHCTYGFAGATMPDLGDALVLTDGELAALATPPGTLTITLGLGPGGALAT